MNATDLAVNEVQENTNGKFMDNEHVDLESSDSIGKMASFPRNTPSNRLTQKPDGALQQLSTLLGQAVKLDNIADFKGSLPTIPINDLRGEEASSYHREDCILRRSLAALYRLIDIRGWTQSIYNHISARCTINPNHFLINPFGLLYHEIQASSLIKIDENGNVIDQGSTILGVNKAGWTLHSALHTARKDVNCIIHVHLPDVIAVSCIRAGLLPVSPEANELITVSGVRYHDYRGILVDEAERSTIQSDLGPKAKILMLRNHGVAVAASSIPEAWYLVKRVVAACQTQMRMMQLMGGANLLSELKGTTDHLSDQAAENTCEPSEEHQNSENQEKSDGVILNGKASSENGDVNWTPEELEFEAEMRVLDSAGFRTGHVYRQPNLLRRAYGGSTWAGDTYGEQMTGAELMTTDFSTNEYSAAEDLAAAEAAGAEQVAKIMDHVRASRQKNAQRGQWLAKAPNNGIVSSSLIGSPATSSQFGSLKYSSPHPFESSNSPMPTPVKRPESSRTEEQTLQDHSNSSVHNGSVGPKSSYATPPSTSPVISKEDTYKSSVNSDIRSDASRSATLPANVKHLVSPVNSDKTNTLQSADKILLNSDNEVKAQEKKTKKKGSFRIPSFSRKKKQ